VPAARATQKKVGIVGKTPSRVSLKRAKRLKIALLQRGNPGLSNGMFKNKIKLELVGKKSMFTL
jgi:hypothetical protein